MTTNQRGRGTPGHTTVLSPREVGDRNRGWVIRALTDHGPLSRSELAKLASVTRGTVGSIVQGLMDDGLLEELDPIGTGDAGKPRRPLWFASGAGTVAALELRSDEMRAATIDARGTLSRQAVVPVSDPTERDSTVDAAIEALDMIMAESRPIGIGVAVPGGCDPATGEIYGSTQLPSLVGSGLAETIVERFNLPTYVENDSRAQALAEHWFGLGRGVLSYVSIQAGHGLGAGLMLDGVPYRGPQGRGGEIGHTTVVIDGAQCECGSRGCWETVASLQWLEAEADRLDLLPEGEFGVAQLAEMARSDAQAAGLLNQYAANLAVGISTLIRLLAPELVILHGEATLGGEALRASIEREVARQTLEQVPVLNTDLEDRATLLGAAAVVLSDLLHRPTAA